MDDETEKRISRFEKEVQILRERIEDFRRTRPWWNEIAGTFDHDPIYAKAMRLGHKYRAGQAERKR